MHQCPSLVSCRFTLSFTSTRHEETNSKSTLTSSSHTCPVPVSTAAGNLLKISHVNYKTLCLLSFVIVLPPLDLSIDAMDVAGEQQLDVEHNLFKQRLDNDLKAVTTEADKHGTF